MSDPVFIEGKATTAYMEEFLSRTPAGSVFVASCGFRPALPTVANPALQKLPKPQFLQHRVPTGYIVCMPPSDSTFPPERMTSRNLARSRSTMMSSPALCASPHSKSGALPTSAAA